MKEVKIFTTNTCPTCISDKAEVLKTIDNHGMTAQLINAAEVDSAVLEKYNVVSVPTYVIEENGVVLDTVHSLTKLKAALKGE